MEGFFYGFALLMALAITGSGALALRWALRRGELKNFDEKARTIFDDEEPEGQQTDFFPGKKPKVAPKASGSIPRDDL